jgi:hypothetical protein
MYTAGIRIDSAETTASNMTDAILITSSGVDGGVVDAIDASAANITNALNAGANIIAITTGTIGSNDATVVDFVDFDMTGDGLITFASDGAGDQLNMTSPAADWQALVVDAATADSTSDKGIIDLDVDSSTTGASGMNVTFEAVDDDAVDNLYGIQGYIKSTKDRFSNERQSA